jgi:hypothetical protein
LAVVAVPLGFLAWDIADLFADPKSEREVMGENFLEDDLYANAVDELIAAHGREAILLNVYVDLRSAQFSIATGPRKAVVEGFGNRGGGEAYTGGSPVKDYERRIFDGELDAAMTLSELVPDAPRHVVDGLRTHDVGIDDIVSMRFERGTWSVLVRTGPDSAGTRRFSASPDGGIVEP